MYNSDEYHCTVWCFYTTNIVTWYHCTVWCCYATNIVTYECVCVCVSPQKHYCNCS